MGAHTPDAYRYRGGQPAWEYPRPGGNESSSALSARNARRRVPNEDRASQALQSSPFAPREQQAAPEREYAHYDEPSVELARDSSRYGGRRRGEERSYRDREGIAFSAAPARPAPRLVSVDQMYVPAEEVEEARRRHVLAYHYEQRIPVRNPARLPVRSGAGNLGSECSSLDSLLESSLPLPRSLLWPCWSVVRNKSLLLLSLPVRQLLMRRWQLTGPAW